MSTKIYDIIGIGIGPFNLGLAALADSIPELNCIFFDQAESFQWHPGLLLNTARLQVPFYADLVTLADPCNRFSYLNYLKSNYKLFRFAIHEQYFPTRKEYNRYCQWVAAELSNLRFSSRCTSIERNGAEDSYAVSITSETTGLMETFHAKHVILGTGTVAYMPDVLKDINHPLVFHSGQYLFKKNDLLQTKNISIIGSGQSAAEIFNDLLSSGFNPGGLQWFTRSERFFPMDYSKFSLEMTSPDYIHHFYHLTASQKAATLKRQDHLYKGINFSLISEIYDQLYMLTPDDPTRLPGIYANCELEQVLLPPKRDQDDGFELFFRHGITQEKFSVVSEAVILGTGYRNVRPDFIQPIAWLLKWDRHDRYALNRNYSADEHNSIFIQNDDLHSHGFNSADLGMGPYRNGIILNAILGREHFLFTMNNSFQQFGIPKK